MEQGIASVILNAMLRRFAIARSVLIVGLLASECPAADLTYTGNLRLVTRTFIHLRLADGRLIDAKLPKTGTLAADAIAAQYKVADQVQITLKPISGELDLTVDLYHFLELKQIRLVRAPTPDEVLQVNTSLWGDRGENLLKPSSVAPSPKPPAPAIAKEFEQIRDVNLDYISRLPSFIADEVAVRTHKLKGSDKWKDKDTIESEIAFKGGNATRQNIRFNGKLWNKPTQWLPGGPTWSVGFGTVLKPLFDRDCENQIAFEGRKEIEGAATRSFTFRAPMDGCFGAGVYGYELYDGGKAGRILVDDAGNVIQMEHHDVGLPADLGPGSTYVFKWGEVKIGDATHLLPIALEWTWLGPNGDTWHVTASFRNHRHFEASTTFQFEESPAPK
jgi:hypothetical protein